MKTTRTAKANKTILQLAASFLIWFFPISLFQDPRHILLSAGDVRGILRALSRKLGAHYCIWFLPQFRSLTQTLGIIFDCLVWHDRQRVNCLGDEFRPQMKCLKIWATVLVSNEELKSAIASVSRSTFHRITMKLKRNAFLYLVFFNVFVFKTTLP